MFCLYVLCIWSHSQNSWTYRLITINCVRRSGPHTEGLMATTPHKARQNGLDGLYFQHINVRKDLTLHKAYPWKKKHYQTHFSSISMTWCTLSNNNPNKKGGNTWSKTPKNRKDEKQQKENMLFLINPLKFGNSMLTTCKEVVFNCILQTHVQVNFNTTNPDTANLPNNN